MRAIARLPASAADAAATTGAQHMPIGVACSDMSFWLVCTQPGHVLARGLHNLRAATSVRVLGRAREDVTALLTPLGAGRSTLHDCHRWHAMRA